MTTIAYRNGTLSSDSQISVNDTRYAKSGKVKKFANGALAGWSGNLVEGSRFLALLEKSGGKLTDKIIHKCPNVDALYVSPEGAVLHVRGGEEGGTAPLEGEFFADGTGYVAALAAMKAGADAVWAVEIACELDTGSSLPVVAVSLDKPVKKKRKTR